jgi:asparagine synthase (glutamine-hydrolysing)
MAEKQLSDADVERIRAHHPQAHINSKEAAYYFQIFRQFHPQDSILRSIGYGRVLISLRKDSRSKALSMEI